MANAKAYGSITIVDISDLGTLSIYPESNQPTSVIYDPNQNNGIYNPDWSANNLILTPVIYYGGSQLDAKNINVTVSWQRKVGSDPTLTDITTTLNTKGEQVNASKQLVVNKNVLTTNSAIITYICKVQYKEPESKTILNAQGQITFSLIAQPTNIKSCQIIGESVFLYGSDQNLKGTEEITLTAKLTNCSIQNWQYKNSSDSWITITGQTSSTITIKHDATYFNNDVATIRLNTDVDSVYDIHTITKIRDGAPGEGVLSVTLTNEDMYIPCDAQGNPVAEAFTEAKTTVIVYSGNDDVTTDTGTSYNVTANGATGTWNENTHTYTVTSLSATTATINFKVTYDGKTVTKTFYLTKLKAGTDGVTPELIQLELSTVTVKKTQGNDYSPSSFTAKAYKIIGDTKTAYSGRFKIYYNNNTSPSITSLNDEDTKTITPSDNSSVTSYKIELYAKGGTTTLRDTQTVTVISDGDKGDTGDGGLSFVLGNQSDTIPCDSSGKTLAAYTITIPFTAYKGINRVACTASVSSTGSDFEMPTITSATTSANGTITIKVKSGKDIGNGANTGTFNITLTAEGVTSTHTYTWTKSKQGSNGAAAILLRTYAPNGNVINNGENDVALTAILTKGTSTVTSGLTYKWSVFEGTTYTEITSSDTKGGHSGYTTATLTVPKNAVHSYAAYKVEVSYSGKTYTDYITVQDKTDPLQVEIFSTLGDKITNSVGVGCIYARVYQNGEELDPLQNLKVSESAPSSAVSGDVWVQIDSANTRLLYKEYNGSAWQAFTPKYADCTYNWTFGNYNGIATSFNGARSSDAKFLYVQGSYINKKTQFNLEVNKK